MRQAIVAGAGHGGTEALILGLQYVLVPVIVMLWFPYLLPVELRNAPFSAVTAVINGAARIAFVVCHIGFTVLVWRAVSLRRISLYVAAVVLHVLLDLVAFVLPLVVPGTDWLIWVLTFLLLGWTLIQIVPVLYAPRRWQLGMQQKWSGR